MNLATVYEREQQYSVLSQPGDTGWWAAAVTQDVSRSALTARGVDNSCFNRSLALNDNLDKTIRD